MKQKLILGTLLIAFSGTVMAQSTDKEAHEQALLNQKSTAVTTRAVATSNAASKFDALQLTQEQNKAVVNALAVYSVEIKSQDAGVKKNAAETRNSSIKAVLTKEQVIIFKQQIEASL